MVNTVPISDLANYDDVLGEVTYGNPVYLHGNGHEDYAIITMRDFNELKAVRDLFAALSKGEESASKEGWISLDDAQKALGV